MTTRPSPPENKSTRTIRLVHHPTLWPTYFPELARLGPLESELFVDDSRFKDRAKLRPDPARKALFVQEIAQADRLADAALQRPSVDANALFVK